MKRKLVISTILLLLCALLSSCGLLFPAQKEPEDTKSAEEALFDELAAIRDVSPTKVVITYTAAYAAYAVTLEGTVTFTMGSDGASLYRYRADRLLTSEEALEEGAPKKQVSGWIYSPAEGNALTSSPELEESWLSEGGGEYLFHPLRLQRSQLSAFSAKETPSGYRLSATIRPESIASVLSSNAEALTSLSYELTLNKNKQPTSARLTAETEAKGSITLDITFSYQSETVTRPEA